ncbi:MAG TPA: 3-isopropylmalate dehydratase small subunit [Caulobacteraceae bacterium]|jgi:3-isopropylmalate/(R)-2-methylmalate dehydratase small subunit
MEPITRLEARAVPIDRPNVDTDQIVPARYLQKPRSAPFGDFLFRDLRFDADGSEKSGFVLNQPGYRGAKIVVAEENFGCGSSREHAVWALYDYGVRAVIAPSFGDIFASNSAKNGLLTVALPAGQVKAMIEALAAEPGLEVAVDLDAQTVSLPDGPAHRFEIDPYRKHLLLNGLDELGFTLSQLAQIEAFEKTYAG